MQPSSFTNIGRWLWQQTISDDNMINANLELRNVKFEMPEKTFRIWELLKFGSFWYKNENLCQKTLFVTTRMTKTDDENNNQNSYESEIGLFGENEKSMLNSIRLSLTQAF